MSYKYSIELDYVGDKEITSVIGTLNIDELLSVTFTANEHIHSTEVQEIFEDEMLSIMAQEVDEKLPISVETDDLLIAEVTVTEL